MVYTISMHTFNTTTADSQKFRQTAGDTHFIDDPWTGETSQTYPVAAFFLLSLLATNTYFVSKSFNKSLIRKHLLERNIVTMPADIFWLLFLNVRELRYGEICTLSHSICLGDVMMETPSSGPGWNLRPQVRVWFLIFFVCQYWRFISGTLFWITHYIIELNKIMKHIYLSKITFFNWKLFLKINALHLNINAAEWCFSNRDLLQY